MKKIDRIGEVNFNTYGLAMKIIEYNNCRNIVVQFENGYKKTTTYQVFEQGQITNPYFKSIFNQGYLGVGIFKTDNKEGRKSKEYHAWTHMSERCYNEKFQEKQPTYKECSVCEEWLNFQNFAKWYNENYYEVEGQVMSLDKDILLKGNKIYSPETCMLVPKNINELFTKRQNHRGNYSIGVGWHKRDNVFYASCSNGNGKNKSLGYYNTILEAFQAYQKYKENLTKQIADKYKDKIPQKLYEALYNYKVEITD